MITWKKSNFLHIGTRMYALIIISMEKIFTCYVTRVHIQHFRFHLFNISMKFVEIYIEIIWNVRIWLHLFIAIDFDIQDAETEIISLVLIVNAGVIVQFRLIPSNWYRWEKLFGNCVCIRFAILCFAVLYSQMQSHWSQLNVSRAREFEKSIECLEWKRAQTKNWMKNIHIHTQHWW